MNGIASYLLLATGITLAGCLDSAETASSASTQHRLLDVLIETRTGQTVEFPDVHGVLSYEAAKSKRSLLDSLLELRGFVGQKRGYGNYPPLGPRIATIELIREDCRCTVHKLYYHTLDRNRIRLAESIRCETIE